VRGGVPAKQNASKETTTASFIVNKGSEGSGLVAENEEEEDTTSVGRAAFPTNYNYFNFYLFFVICFFIFVSLVQNDEGEGGEGEGEEAAQ
jgi:hypothetical protein